MERCVSVLTAVLLLHENTDHVTGVHESNQLHEGRAKGIVRTHQTLLTLLVQQYINTGVTAKFKQDFLPFPVFVCRLQRKWSQTAELKRQSLLCLRCVILQNLSPVPLGSALMNTAGGKHVDFGVQVLLTFL